MFAPGKHECYRCYKGCKVKTYDVVPHPASVEAEWSHLPRSYGTRVTFPTDDRFYQSTSLATTSPNLVQDRRIRAKTTVLSFIMQISVLDDNTPYVLVTCMITFAAEHGRILVHTLSVWWPCSSCTANKTKCLLIVVFNRLPNLMPVMFGGKVTPRKRQILITVDGTVNTVRYRDTLLAIELVNFLHQYGTNFIFL
jgi:hypothetical protein